MKILAMAYPWADAAMANLSECPTSVDALASRIARAAYYSFTDHQIATKKEKRDVREYMESLEGLEEYVDLAYATWVEGKYSRDE